MYLTFPLSPKKKFNFMKSRIYNRNPDISEIEDFDFNVKPFINPGEIARPIIDQCGKEFCGALVEDVRVLRGWEIITVFKPK